jgi:hypothetical protein
MNDFEFDCLQKKRLAQQAKYRKRGSKSKKCPMSTDHMTKKQWIERCGKIVTIKMDSPVSWASFKELSKQTQEEYLKNLMEKYHINASSLAEMFHITPITVRRHIATQGLAVSFPVGHSMNAEDRRAWELFLSGDAVEQSENEVCLENEEMCDEEPMSMCSFSLRFSGKIDVSMISNSLVRILGDHSVGEIEVTCNLAP